MICLAEYLQPGDLIVLDSVASLVPKAELEGEVSDAPMAGQARLVSKAMRLLVPAISRTGVMINWINQYRVKFNASSWGVQKKGAGGDVLPFFCSIRMEVANLGKIKDGEEVIGQKVRVKSIKNKTFPPFREFDGEIRFGEGGFAKKADTLAIAMDRGIITKKGSWISYGDQRIGQGKENAIIYLKEHPEVLAEIDQKIKDGVVG
jgi:recombination protein RecA